MFQGNVERLQFWSGVLTFKCIYSYFMHIILLESLVEFDGFIYMYFIYFVIGRKAVFLNSQLPGDDDVSIYIAI